MITVTYENHTIKAVGHANYAEVGKDIVCAGVSILTYTLVVSLTELTEDDIEVELDSGKNIIKFKENPSKRAQLLIDSFFIGIQALVAEYPDYVNCPSIEDTKSNGKQTS